MATLDPRSVLIPLASVNFCAMTRGDFVRLFCSLDLRMKYRAATDQRLARALRDLGGMAGVW